MNRRPRWAAGLAITTIMVAAGVANATSGNAQPSGGGVDLVAQTLFVDDDPAEVVVRVSGAPDDARLEFTIFADPDRTAEAARAHHRDPPTAGTRLSLFSCTLEGDCGDQATMEAGEGGISTITLSDADIGEALRANQGALPFVIRLVGPGGATLDEISTSLLVLDRAEHTLATAFLARTRAPVAHQPDESIRLDRAGLFERAAVLEDRPGLPATIDVGPETLDALAAVDGESLDRLVGIIGDRGALRTPWVAMDEEAWRVIGESERVLAEYAVGTETLESFTGHSPTAIVRLDPDTAPSTLGLLRSTGATVAIVDDTLVPPVTGRARIRQPFEILDDNGVAMTALRIEEPVQQTLGGDDSILAGYRAASELALIAANATTDLGVVLDLDEIDPVALDVVLDTIADRADLRLARVEALAELDLARTVGGEIVRAPLDPRPAPDVGSLAAALAAAERSTATYGEMLAPEEGPIAPLLTLLGTAVASDLSAVEAEAYPRAVDAAVRAGTDGLTVAQGDRITLTDRRTDLPITIVNGQPRPMNVTLHLAAEKLRFPDGDRLDLRLRPGDNAVVIAVETLASGDARVTAELTSPDGRVDLGSGTVDIRSTAISGLGLVISIVALVVLAAWWIRTILRVRRNRAAATVTAAGSGEGPQHQGEP